MKETEHTAETRGVTGTNVAFTKSFLRKIRNEARKKYKGPKRPIVRVNIFNLPKEFPPEASPMSDFKKFLTKRVQTVVDREVEVKVNICTKGMVSSSVLRQCKMAFKEESRDYFKFTVDIVWACTENLIRYERHNEEILRVVNWEIAKKCESETDFVRVVQLAYGLWSIPLKFLQRDA